MATRISCRKDLGEDTTIEVVRDTLTFWQSYFDTRRSTIRNQTGRAKLTASSHLARWWRVDHFTLPDFQKLILGKSLLRQGPSHFRNQLRPADVVSVADLFACRTLSFFLQSLHVFHHIRQFLGRHCLLQVSWHQGNLLLDHLFNLAAFKCANDGIVALDAD